MNDTDGAVDRQNLSRGRGNKFLKLGERRRRRLRGRRRSGIGRQRQIGVVSRPAAVRRQICPAPRVTRQGSRPGGNGAVSARRWHRACGRTGAIRRAGLHRVRAIRCARSLCQKNMRQQDPRNQRIQTPKIAKHRDTVRWPKAGPKPDMQFASPFANERLHSKSLQDSFPAVWRHAQGWFAVAKPPPGRIAIVDGAKAGTIGLRQERKVRGMNLPISKQGGDWRNLFLRRESAEKETEKT